MAAPSAQLSRFNRPFDANLQLQDDTTAAASSFSGAVAGSPVIRDLGDGWTGLALAVVDINSIDVANTDESYLFCIQGATSSDMATGRVILAMQYVGCPAGASSGGANVIFNNALDRESASTVLTNSKRLFIPFHNEKLGVIYRYARLRVVIGGTTPSIDPEAYITKLP